jgi:hypothetical protein
MMERRDTRLTQLQDTVAFLIRQANASWAGLLAHVYATSSDARHGCGLCLIREVDWPDDHKGLRARVVWLEKGRVGQEEHVPLASVTGAPDISPVDLLAILAPQERAE